MSNNKQSSVDFIVNLLIEKGYAGVLNEDEIEQAKAMHKEEVLNFDSLLDKHQINAYKNNTIYLSREEFYNETFGDNK